MDIKELKKLLQLEADKSTLCSINKDGKLNELIIDVDINAVFDIFNLFIHSNTAKYGNRVGFYLCVATVDKFNKPCIFKYLIGTDEIKDFIIKLR